MFKCNFICIKIGMMIDAVQIGMIKYKYRYITMFCDLLSANFKLSKTV